MTITRIYIRFKGRVLGPISLEKAQEMVRRGQLTRQHEVSPDGSTWNPAAAVPELFASRKDRQEARVVGENAAVGRASPPSEIGWYANFDGSNQGPTDEAGIKQWIGMGKVTRSTLVWRDGMANWSEAGVVQPIWFVGVPLEASYHGQFSHGFSPSLQTSTKTLSSNSRSNDSYEPSEKNVLATVSLVAGISSLTIGCCCWLHIPLGLTAIICGILGINRSHAVGSGFGLALAGTICGGIALVLITALYLLGLAVNLASIPQ